MTDVMGFAIMKVISREAVFNHQKIHGHVKTVVPEDAAWSMYELGDENATLGDRPMRVGDLIFMREDDDDYVFAKGFIQSINNTVDENSGEVQPNKLLVIGDIEELTNV